MPGGGKQAIINNLERALSVDVNRLQLFEQASRAEGFRYLMDVGTGNDDLDASGVLTQTTTSTSPLTGDVVNGFCVRPGLTASGTGLDLAVDPGVAYVVSPDGDTDSSVYKLAKDPGLATGTIFITTNSSGQTRIDVVECSYGLVTSETDNRDIFNPSTNTFVATSVSKATQGALTYRVRAGTPGSGYPGPASGWMPLAVASVPTGTTGNDTVTFWDVRPLAQDRVFAPFNIGRSAPLVQQCNWQVDAVTGGNRILTGEVTAWGGDRVGTKSGFYRLGGRLRRGTPGSDSPGGVDGVDLADTANFSGALGTTAYLYLLEPFGLPRWARYTDATTGSRKPRSPRGILVVSAVQPQSFYGGPSSAINLPTSTGLGTSTTSGACIGQLYTANPGGGQVVGTTVCANRKVWTPTYNTGVAGTTGGSLTKFLLTEGTTHPPFARVIHADISVRFAVAANSNVTVSLVDSGLYNAAGAQFNLSAVGLPQLASSTTMAWSLANATGGSLNLTISIRMAVPIVSGYPSTTSDTSAMQLTFSGGGNVVSSGFSPYAFEF